MNEKEDWLNRWACGSTGRVMFKEMRPQDAINQLDRQDQSLIFQFRTQHTRTNQHLNRINPLHQPHCRHCDNPAETTEHLLLYCPNIQLKRKELLPTNPTNPTIHSTLYGQLDQLKKTSTFIHLALTAQEWRTQKFGINNNNNNNNMKWKQIQTSIVSRYYQIPRQKKLFRGRISKLCKFQEKKIGNWNSSD